LKNRHFFTSRGVYDERQPVLIKERGNRLTYPIRRSILEDAKIDEISFWMD